MVSRKVDSFKRFFPRIFLISLSVILYSCGGGGGGGAGAGDSGGGAGAGGSGGNEANEDGSPNNSSTSFSINSNNHIVAGNINIFCGLIILGGVTHHEFSGL